MKNDFLIWLNGELDKRGWDRKALSRRTKFSSSAIYQTLNGQNSVTYDFCNEVARALGESPVKVMRLAGLLPRVPDTKDSETVQSIVDLLGDMDEVNRKDALAYIRLRFSNPIRE